MTQSSYDIEKWICAIYSFFLIVFDIILILTHGPYHDTVE